MRNKFRRIAITAGVISAASSVTPASAVPAFAQISVKSGGAFVTANRLASTPISIPVLRLLLSSVPKEIVVNPKNGQIESIKTTSGPVDTIQASEAAVRAFLLSSVPKEIVVNPKTARIVSVAVQAALTR